MPIQSPKIDYAQLIKNYPWVTQRGQNCILSPDSDGLLCGLLMSHYLGWRVRGFYDGKVLFLEKNVRAEGCIFLDMEIFRKNIRSIGQHMVAYDKKNLPLNWANFDNCISANRLRNYDFKNDFKEKYPLGTIHLLLGILGHIQDIPIKKSAIGPLLYADGTFKNQFNYPENCLSWLEFLRADEGHNPLKNIFLNKHFSTYELMLELRQLFSTINVIGSGKRGGDKVKISSSKGKAVNIDSMLNLEKATQNQAVSFLKMLAEKTGWSFNAEHWSWGPFKIFQFRKGSVKPGKARYNDLLKKNPVSLAVISRNSIEYTLDEAGVL